jgi:hypothetical protein
MDKKTEETRDWLDSRFRTVRDGIYMAHQPIYGFVAKYSEHGKFAKWVTTHSLLQELSKWVPAAVLDVGSAEGWFAYLCRKFFGSKVKIADLSVEACIRAKELFDIDGIACDVQNLPPMEPWDTVVCSGMLEHVPDWKRSVNNLLDVTQRVLVLMLPLEGKRRVSKKISSGEPHSHLHVFTTKSFDYLRKDHDVKVIRIHSMLLYYLGAALDYVPFIGEWPMIFLTWLDQWLCELIPWSRGVLFVIRPRSQKVTARAVVQSKIGFHYLKDSSEKA